MITRKSALKTIIESAGSDTRFVSCLGRTSRDLYALTKEMRERCLYNMGAMGSILPITLGMAIAQEQTMFIGIEGDGSILMNLGSLVTLKRYGKRNICLIILDNGIYESTGGQPSHPKDFQIENVCKAVGLRTYVAQEANDINLYFSSSTNIEVPSVLIIKTKAEEVSERISEHPKEIAVRFMNHIMINA
jgi:thiamine pyrophosphate-dependent acetolactate synthase large subunit-like protein